MTSKNAVLRWVGDGNSRFVPSRRRSAAVVDFYTTRIIIPYTHTYVHAQYYTFVPGRYYIIMLYRVHAEGCSDDDDGEGRTRRRAGAFGGLPRPNTRRGRRHDVESRQPLTALYDAGVAQRGDGVD
jgi:hypothetical protein